MAGRKRIPDAKKKARGTFQPCRSNPDAPTPSDDAPMPPACLSELERRWFITLLERLGPMDVASATDTEIIMLAAKRLAEIEELDEQIAENGRVIRSINVKGEELLRSNPAVTQKNDAMRHLQSLLAEMGLSPASRSKVSARKKQQPIDNPFTKRGVN